MVRGERRKKESERTKMEAEEDDQIHVALNSPRFL